MPIHFSKGMGASDTWYSLPNQGKSEKHFTKIKKSPE